MYIYIYIAINHVDEKCVTVSVLCIYFNNDSVIVIV